MYLFSKRYLPFAALCAILILSQSCGKVTTTSTDYDEIGQQVGDVMASMDESSGNGTGTFASVTSVPPAIGEGRAVFARLAPSELQPAWYQDLFVKRAQAATCLSTASSQFSSCTGTPGVITRTYGDCTVGGATFSGTVSLTWAGTNANTCGALTGTSDSVTRSPNFTVTGLRSATLTVAKSGTVGQKVTYVSGTGTSKVYSFTSDGIRRIFKLSGATIFDYTTTTTSAITMTGTLRTDRTLSGGALRVTNNTSSVTCDYVPTAVKWTSSTCNCPISGSWAATCSDGKSSTLTISGCGSATLTVGSDSQSVSFDRCYGT